MPFLLMTFMKNNFSFLALAALLNGTCFSMILPLLAPLIRQLELSEVQGGIIVSAGAIGMAISSLWVAQQKKSLSPNQLVSLGFWGMTLTWAIFSLVLYLGIQMLLPISLIFILLVISRASTGIFMALPQIGLQSYVMTHCTEEQTRSKYMALFGAMNSFGMIVGPFATAVLLFGGILFPIWVAVIMLGVVSCLLSLTLNKNTPCRLIEVKQHSNPKNIQQDSPLAKQSLVWLLLGFAIYMSIVTLNMTAGFYIQDKFVLDQQKSALYFSHCMLIVGVSLVTTQLVIIKVFQLSIQGLMTIGLILINLGLLLSIFSPNLLIFRMSYIFYGIAIACLLPVFTTGAAQSAPPSAQVKIASWCTTTQAIGLIIGHS